MELTEQFFVGGTDQWRISDNSTLFQISVFPQLFRHSKTLRMKRSSETALLDASEAAMHSLEGPSLEKFAATCFGEMTGVSWHDHGLWRQRQQRPYTDSLGRQLPPLADIDAMALQGEWNDPKPILVMAGCKRDANDHSTVQLQKQFDAMLNDIGNTPDGRRIRSFRKERYLISPQFAGDQREKYRPTGFKCCDIRDLARELGVDPGPEPEAGAGQSDALAAAETPPDEAGRGAIARYVADRTPWHFNALAPVGGKMPPQARNADRKHWPNVPCN